MCRLSAFKYFIYPGEEHFLLPSTPILIPSSLRLFLVSFLPIHPLSFSLLTFLWSSHFLLFFLANLFIPFFRSAFSLSFPPQFFLLYLPGFFMSPFLPKSLKSFFPLSFFITYSCTSLLLFFFIRSPFPSLPPRRPFLPSNLLDK